jgi:hypothetical protein
MFAAPPSFRRGPRRTSPRRRRCRGRPGRPQRSTRRIDSSGWASAAGRARRPRQARDRNCTAAATGRRAATARRRPFPPGRPAPGLLGAGGDQLTGLGPADAVVAGDDRTGIPSNSEQVVITPASSAVTRPRRASRATPVPGTSAGSMPAVPAALIQRHQAGHLDRLPPRAVPLAGHEPLLVPGTTLAAPVTSRGSWSARPASTARAHHQAQEMTTGPQRPRLGRLPGPERCPGLRFTRPHPDQGNASGRIRGQGPG